MSDELQPSDRRRTDRRADWVPLAEYTVPELRKAAVTIFLLLLILGLFLYMVRKILVPGVAGVVLGVYTIPLQRMLQRRFPRRRASSIVTIVLVTVPLVALVAYSWIEITGAANYLNQHQREVAHGLAIGLHRLPFTQGLRIEQDLSALVGRAASKAGNVADALTDAINIIVLSIAVVLFTFYYILTDHERILAYLARKVPGRYRELTDEMSSNIRAVVYGALYGTFLTQALKSVVLLVLNVGFDIPLAVVLAIASFFIGLFPIVGSWAIYVPVSIYLVLWRGNVIEGVIVLVVGFGFNTLFLSTYLRPKIAAEKSQVLNFYWMLIALITGVYTFGLVGIIIGPVLIAVLKAIFDTITGGAAQPVLGARVGDRGGM